MFAVYYMEFQLSVAVFRIIQEAEWGLGACEVGIDGLNIKKQAVSHSAAFV